MSEPRLHRSLAVRRVFIGLGFLALLLGAIGIFLPLLPTVPFILLAAFCFARGSEHFHQRLLDHHLTGPLIKDWYTHKSVKPSAKRWAYLLTAVSFSFSIFIVEMMWLKLTLAALGLFVIFNIWRIPVRHVEAGE
jgi:uncharacterized membrane protein YbaN (DUF454 family)